ncbi:MAG TPA: MMPL family transporter, partial [Lysobacter sp.]
MPPPSLDGMPVVRTIEDFDHRSGHVFERAIFNNRLLIVIACALLTVLLGFQATKLAINAGFEKMIPHGHAYVKNYLESRGSLRGLGNSVRVVVENTDGDIFDPQYLEVLKQVNDELFLNSDVDRAWMKSIWTPAVRWSEVNEEGFVGGPVMPDNYDGTPASVDALKLNIRRANIVGNLVANDFRSSMVFVPLLERNADTGQRLDYHAFSQKLEQSVRAKYGNDKIKIHVIGFAKLAGDLIEGLVKVASFFLIAALIAALIIFLYTRCLRSTVLVVACSVVAVVWQLGLVRLFGFELDPFSVLVPFLIFAIGVSHGAQKMNGIMQDVGRGTHRLVAARYTFRRLFLAGLTALLADVVGFAVLMTIDIPVIKELALTASIGVGVLVFTNLILLPVLLSYVGVSPAAAKRSLREEDEEAHGRGFGAFWNFLDKFTERRWAIGAITVAVVLAAGGLWISRGLQIGDLDPGAPELRKDSRYNQDNAYITKNYALSSDLFAVIVKTKKDACLNYKTLVQADRLGWALQQDPSVQTTVSLADAVRNITAGSFEGNPKWLTLNRNQDVINYSGQQATVLNPDLFNTECSVLPVIAYLADHKADSLKRVAAIAEDFAA